MNSFTNKFEKKRKKKKERSRKIEIWSCHFCYIYHTSSI